MLTMNLMLDSSIHDLYSIRLNFSYYSFNNVEPIWLKNYDQNNQQVFWTSTHVTLNAMLIEMRNP